MSDIPITDYALTIRERFDDANTPTTEQLHQGETWKCTEYPVHTASPITYGGTEYGYEFELSLSQRFPGIPTYDAKKTREIGYYFKELNSLSGAYTYEFQWTVPLAPTEFSYVNGLKLFTGSTGSNDQYSARFHEGALLLERHSSVRRDSYCAGKLRSEPLIINMVSGDADCTDPHSCFSNMDAITPIRLENGRLQRRFVHSYSVCELESGMVSQVSQSQSQN